MPILSVSAHYAARRILAGIRDGDAEVVFPVTMRLAELARSAFPELFALTMREAARFFPQGNSTERRTGAEKPQLAPRATLVRPAAPALGKSAKGLQPDRALRPRL